MEYSIIVIATTDSKVPLDELFHRFHQDDKNRIIAKLITLARGSKAQSKSRRKGLFELKIYGIQAYRVYYTTSLKSKLLLIILLGGIKKTQSKDIIKAYGYIKSYIREGILDENHTFQNFLEKI